MDAGLIYIQHILFRIKPSGLICARYGAVGGDAIKGGFVSSTACMDVLETGYRRSPPLQPLHLPRTHRRREGASEITSRLCHLMLPSGQEKGSPDSSSFTVVCNKVARAVLGCSQPTQNWSSPGTSPCWFRRGGAACMFASLVRACRALHSSWSTRG